MAKKSIEEKIADLLEKQWELDQKLLEKTADLSDKQLEKAMDKYNEKVEAIQEKIEELNQLHAIEALEPEEKDYEQEEK